MSFTLFPNTSPVMDTEDVVESERVDTVDDLTDEAYPDSDHKSSGTESSIMPKNKKIVTNESRMQKLYYHVVIYTT